MVRGLGLGLWGVCASGVVCCLRLSIRDGVCERLIYFVSRDRSYSASRSVVLRVEIGPLPHRNRLHSAARLWCVRTSESRCVLRVWLSSVLHMGDQGFGGVRVGSCWNDGLFRRSWCMTVGLPCAVRGSAHMGAGPWPLLTVLFRMIPRFLLMWGVHECATSTAPGRAWASGQGSSC